MIIDQKPVPGRGTLIAYIPLFSIFAALVVASVAGMSQFIDIKRAVGVVLAALLAVTGNFLPKLLHPDRNSADGVRQQRRSGWGLVLTGALLIIAILAAPASQIGLWSGVVGIGGLSVVFVYALSHSRPEGGARRGDFELEAMEKKHASSRLSALFIVHAIGWAFAMLLADYLWGNSAIVWMVIAFAVSNGLLAAAHASIFRARPRQYGEG